MNTFGYSLLQRPLESLNIVYPNKSFEKIFKELSELSKSEIEVEIKKQYIQYYKPFLYNIVFLLFIFCILVFTKVEVNYKH